MLPYVYAKPLWMNLCNKYCVVKNHFCINGSQAVLKNVLSSSWHHRHFSALTCAQCATPGITQEKNHANHVIAEDIFGKCFETNKSRIFLELTKSALFINTDSLSQRLYLDPNPQFPMISLFILPWEWNAFAKQHEEDFLMLVCTRTRLDSTLWVRQPCPCFLLGHLYGLFRQKNISSTVPNRTGNQKQGLI